MEALLVSPPSSDRERELVLGNDLRQVSLRVEDLCRHTIVFGSSGSGKTTRAFNPLLAEMLAELDAGAFIIAPKGEAVGEAIELARRAGREAIVIEPGGQTGLELLCGHPDVDATYFRDAMGAAADEAGPFLESGVTRLKNALRMLKGAGEQYYTFEHLKTYCFDEKFAASVRVIASERIRVIRQDADEIWSTREALAYEEARFLEFSSETRRSIHFAVSQLLEPLREAQIAKTFSNKQNLVQIESVFDGAIIVLHVPRARYQGAAQAIYTLAKRRFFTALENRRSNAALDQSRPVVFAVDEYQLCISESDVQSLGIVRSAGCMVLATTHGVSSLYAAMPKTQVDAALQNFTQKIFFKTDDHETLALLDRATQHAPEKLDTACLFSMNRNQAICHLTVGDSSIDAIVSMSPLFIAPDYFSSFARGEHRMRVVAGVTACLPTAL